MREAATVDSWWKHLDHPGRSRLLPDRQISIGISRFNKNQNPDFYVVFFGGNVMEQINSEKMLLNLMGHFNRFSEFTFSAVTMEYPGFGCLRDQWACEENVLIAARATLIYLLHDRGIPLEKIVLMGFSIGTGSAVELAQGLSLFSQQKQTQQSLRRQKEHVAGPAGLILIAPFRSIRTAATHNMRNMARKKTRKNDSHRERILTAAPRLISERFDNLRKIKDITCPTLYVHGDRDQMFPHSETELLAEAQHPAAYKKVAIIKGLDHFPMGDEEEVDNEIERFLIKLKRDRQKVHSE
jgi:pimeloyl-ACP methyl ester carboxylesterase